MVGNLGLEPRTNAVSGRCSTTELIAIINVEGLAGVEPAFGGLKARCSTVKPQAHKKRGCAPNILYINIRA